MIEFYINECIYISEITFFNLFIPSTFCFHLQVVDIFMIIILVNILSSGGKKPQIICKVELHKMFL